VKFVEKAVVPYAIESLLYVKEYCRCFFFVICFEAEVINDVDEL
jgi:hypothetical protein